MQDFPFYLWLAIAAGLALVGIGVHAVWSARKSRPRMAEPPPAARPTSGPDRLEPSLGEAAAPQSTPALAEPDDGPVLADDTTVAPLVAPPAALRLGARLDALVDALVPITLDAPVSGEIAVAHLPGSRRAGKKPMDIEGLNADTGRWELPAHGRRYSEFQAGVLLANRLGPLNEIEYSEFVQKVQSFAEGVGAMADFPDMLEVVARARELDAFARPRDAQLSLVLRARSVAWSVGYIQQCAARQGFVPGVVPGRLVVPGEGEGDPPMLVLSFDPQAALADDPQASAVRELLLTLDVAQTPEAAEPFPAWHRVATLLASEMEATLVDEDGVPITLQLFDGIARQLDALYRELEARDLTAGSAAARRLFS
jgi:hypothetical protein